jgi:hypothetical protein
MDWWTGRRKQAALVSLWACLYLLAHMAVPCRGQQGTCLEPIVETYLFAG